MDEILAEPSEAGDSVGATSVGTIPEPAEPAPVPIAAPPTPTEFQVLVRESSTTTGCWFMWHKELKMSRWLELKQPLPSTVKLLRWDIGEENGHAYVLPKLEGPDEITNELTSANAMWVPCVSSRMTLSFEKVKYGRMLEPKLLDS